MPVLRTLRSLLPLLLITVFGGALRFYNLDHPSLWYDESMVFRRTCGTYGQLLDCLRTDGFVPLHYSFVWALSQFVKPTPVMLRFFPALCGTLMVPAVYFLSRQMLPRATSLVAAAFTACSAFMLFYSRDAKMYMDAWLFTALNAGCVLWWFRTNKFTAWLCWIATGCAACGLQILCAIPVAISLMLLFTQRKMRWQQIPLWIVGFVLILSGPVGYYEKFNHWKDDDGLRWIELYNQGRTGPELARFYSTTVMMGWEWPKDADIKLLQPERFGWPARSAELLMVIFVAACLPWPRRWRGTPVLRYSQEPGVFSATDPALQGYRGAPRFFAKILNRRDPETQRMQRNQTTDDTDNTDKKSNLISSLSVPSVVRNPLRVSASPRFKGFWLWRSATLRTTSEPASPEIEPQWRIALWLSLWIFIPLYGFYCRSMHHFSSPLGWWRWLTDTCPALQLWMWIFPALILVTIISGTIYFPQVRPMVFRRVKLLVVFAALIGLCQAMAIVMASQSEAATRAHTPWMSMWVPRYIGFVWPMLAVAVAAMLMRLPTKWVRAIAILFLLGLNLAIGSFRILGQTEPPVDLMAADFLQAQTPPNHTITWTHLRMSMQYPGGENIFGEPGQYYLQMLENKPTDPVRFMEAMYVRRNPGLRRMPWDRSMPSDLNRIILWSEYTPDGRALAAEPTLPKTWKLQSDAWYQARDFWIWKDLSRYRRSVFVKN